MHIHLPKPLHGWRAVLGEIGIIVVGVLIALGAEQVVESIHWHNQVEEFRSAADRELAYDLAAYHYRLAQAPCVARRVAELQRWHNDQRQGRQDSLSAEIGRPSLLIYRSSVWAARSPEVMTHMPLSKRIAYASLYDRLASIQAQIVDEREAWRSLAAFDGAAKLSDENLMRLTELLFRVQSIDEVIRANAADVDEESDELGIHPRFDGRPPAPDAAFCKPLFR